MMDHSHGGYGMDAHTPHQGAQSESHRASQPPHQAVAAHHAGHENHQPAAAENPASSFSGDKHTRAQEALRAASELYRQRPDWVTYFREIQGVGGAIRGLFPGQEELAWFENTAEYSEIQRQVADLRGAASVPAAPEEKDDKEPTRVITVRLPKSLHELLRREAHERGTSMNKLCISKLLQVIDENLIPSDVQAAVDMTAQQLPGRRVNVEVVHSDDPTQYRTDDSSEHESAEHSERAPSDAHHEYAHSHARRQP